MKTPKILSMAVLATLALAGIASAQTAIYISGAPATRAIFNTAILNTLKAKSTGSPTISQYWSGSGSYASANQIILTGGNIGGTAVTIYGSWTGSTAGNQSVAINPPRSNSALKVSFLNLAAVSGTGGGYTLDTSNQQYPQFTLSDSFQNTIPFHGHVTITSPATNYVTLTEATTHSPAITGYKFVANHNSPASLSNITSNLANQLFTNGSVPLALFSGLNADEGTTVYAVGRDIGSGARYILLAETGIGTANSSGLYQYEPAYVGSGSTATITDIVDHPAPGGTINLITFASGNGGYPSFSAVQNVLAASSSNSSVGYIVTYVTDSDATTAEAAGAHELAWNGVYYGTAKEGAHGTAPTSIAEGQYTYWSYLHVYYNLSDITTNYPLAKTFADYLSTDLSTDTTTGAILTSDLNVTRGLIDGGLVTQNY